MSPNDETARRALRAVFHETIATAPAPPAGLRETLLHRAAAGAPARSSPSVVPSAGPRSNRRWPALVATLGAVAALVVALLVPTTPVQASPEVALQRAAQRFRRFHDVELWIRAESPALRALAGLLGEEDPGPPTRETMRFLFQAPDRFLVQELEDPRAPWTAALPLAGCDGDHTWEYDPESGVLELAPVQPGQFTLHLGEGESAEALEPEDLLRFLSFDFVGELAAEDARFDVTEVTGPSDERAARRVFEATPRGETTEPAGESSFGERLRRQLVARAVVTVDPARDLIEKMVVDVSFTAVSLLRFEVELARTDQRPPATLFDPASHVPPGTEVRRSGD